MQHTNHYVAIMAGGVGSRFWPQSRTAYPKQFLDILNTGKTLIQSTFDRFASFIPIENIYVITSIEYQAIVQQQLPDILIENIVAEPSKKNTGPCVAYISFKLFKKNPNASLIVAPSDHIILDNPVFTSVILKALQYVGLHDAFVTLGIKPTNANTGYGYIQYETKNNHHNDDIYPVKLFTEKPNLELAKIFVTSGDFLWNAGIFVWKVQDIINAFHKHCPEMFELFDGIKKFLNTTKEKEAIETIYPLCKNVSIDIAIMEKSDHVFVIPASFGWSDLGTWTSAYDSLEKDYLENVVTSTDVIIIDATKCMVSAPKGKLLVLQGLDDHIIVDTKDVLLICKKNKEQLIKEYVAEVKRNKGDKYI